MTPSWVGPIPTRSRHSKIKASSHLRLEVFFHPLLVVGTVWGRKLYLAYCQSDFVPISCVGHEDPKTGEKKRKKFVGLPGDRQNEVLKLGRKWVDDISTGLLPHADKITVKGWLDTWLEDYAKQNVRLKSYLK